MMMSDMPSCDSVDVVPDTAVVVGLVIVVPGAAVVGLAGAAVVVELGTATVVAGVVRALVVNVLETGVDGKLNLTHWGEGQLDPCARHQDWKLESLHQALASQLVFWAHMPACTGNVVMANVVGPAVVVLENVSCTCEVVLAGEGGKPELTHCGCGQFVPCAGHQVW